MLCNVGNNCYQKFVRKLASLDPRLIVAEPDTAVKMFKKVLMKIVDTKWRTTE